MSILWILIVVVLAASVIALWRNNWQVGRAWEALVALAAALIAAGVHLWGGVGS
jgi:hypothetical protein